MNTRNVNGVRVLLFLLCHLLYGVFIQLYMVRLRLIRFDYLLGGWSFFFAGME